MKHLLRKQAKRAFTIGMTAIGLGLTGCSLLPPFPDDIQRWDDGAKRAIYTYDEYIFIKDEFKEAPVSCEANYYPRQKDLETILNVLGDVIARHDVQNDCEKFLFAPDSSLLRKHDLVLGFKKSKNETKCRVAIGENPPVNAAEAQSWEEIARDSFPDCEQVQIIAFQTNSKEREAE